MSRREDDGLDPLPVPDDEWDRAAARVQRNLDALLGADRSAHERLALLRTDLELPDKNLPWQQLCDEYAGQARVSQRECKGCRLDGQYLIDGWCFSCCELETLRRNAPPLPAAERRPVRVARAGAGGAVAALLSGALATVAGLAVTGVIPSQAAVALALLGVIFFRCLRG